MGFWSRILELVSDGKIGGLLPNDIDGQATTREPVRDGRGIVNAAEKAAKLAHVAVIDLLDHPAYFQMARWDRVGTIAGVCAATILLHNRLSPDEFSVAEESLNVALRRFPEGTDALRDCAGFVMRTAKTGGAFDSKMLPMALGMWLLWNVRGDQPPEGEMSAAVIAGQALFECMSETLTS